MQTNTIRIIAAVVDTVQLTLYKENGETIVIPQGDPRIRPIVDTAVPSIISQGFADVSIAADEDNSYVEFEVASNRAVKFFRIAKNELLSLLGVEEAAPVPLVTHISVGTIPSTKMAAQMNAVEEVLQHAIPVASPYFNEEGIEKQGNVVEESGITSKAHSSTETTDTIIAVVEEKIIPGVEKIKSQFTRAAKLGSTKGVETFLQRLGAVINERKHSAADLLTFMERGDLPIADDGSILIYKVLRKNGNRGYVDCHTKKVEQFVGAYVCMDISLVDHNRSNECSNGLHVARRGYVREFRGDVCVLAKVAPEDVIAVPNYDANKMRVCGYHIIAELTGEQYALVKANKPITDNPKGKVLLGNAIAGNHIGKTHEVRITQHMGDGVITTELTKVTLVKDVVAAPAAEALGNPGEKVMDAPINPKEVATKVEQLSRKEIAAQLYATGDIQGLKALKKQAKVSWEKLGVPDPDITPPVVKKEPTPVKSEPVDTKREVNGIELGVGSSRERIQKLLDIGITSVGVAQAILSLKKQAKKSWDVLGVPADVVQQIQKLTQ